MISYLQLEKTADGAMDSNAPVVFDRIMSSSGDQIDYDAATGEIIIRTPGYYHVDWFVAPQSGMTADGCNLSVEITENNPAPTGSSHASVSQTVGFAVIRAIAAEVRVRLINASDSRLTLSQAVNTKAALAIYSAVGGAAAFG